MAALAAGKRNLHRKADRRHTLAEADALITAAATAGAASCRSVTSNASPPPSAPWSRPAGGRALSWDAIRVAPFRPRSLDVSVVLDLMIHDIDLVLTLAGEDPEAVEAVGAAPSPPTGPTSHRRAPPLPRRPRLAVITASRVSLAMERRLRVLGTGERDERQFP